jgi:3-oxoacyl-[acyl-carrier-protein] synthase-3
MRTKWDAKIAGTGHYVPEKVLTNSDLEKIVDTSDEWIRSMTGMVERRVASKDQASSDLAYEASIKAMEMAGIRGKDIGMVICGTVTPDHMFPTTACILQNRIGARGCPALDMSAGCTGFIYGADIARQYVENGITDNILVVGVETLTKIVNWKDRNTCVLFGDGAGAAIISRTKSTDISKVIDSEIMADGAFGDLLIMEAGGSRMPATEETVRENLHTIQMQGNKVFKHAVKSMALVCERVLKRNNMDSHSIDWVVPHQANIRIIDSLAKKLKVDKSKVIVNIEKYGNTSASTIPIALDEAIRSNKIRKGDVVLMTAFGAGLTYGSYLVRI